jgi:hypothetical protein
VLSRALFLNWRAFGDEPIVDIPGGTTPTVVASDAELRAFDDAFEQLKQEAAVDSALDEEKEDAELPPLLSGGLKAWVIGRGRPGRRIKSIRSRDKSQRCTRGCASCSKSG